MSRTYIPVALRRLVEERAGGRCEYCFTAFAFLFNPRTQRWEEHFVLEEGVLRGLSPEGRTTANLLQCNTLERVAERRRLSEVGRYP